MFLLVPLLFSFCSGGYGYTCLVEFTAIPADYLPYYPPTRTGGSAGPSMLPTTWAMVTLPICCDQSGPTHATITRTKEVPLTHHLGHGSSAHPVTYICSCLNEPWELYPLSPIKQYMAILENTAFNPRHSTE